MKEPVQSASDNRTHPDDASYWQQLEPVKRDADLIRRLEQRARTGIPMTGFSLRRTQLASINLVNAGERQGLQLTHSDLYRADLRGAHLFNLDLSHSSLMKANLEGANLHCANLQGCNLLGANLERAKLDNVNWGEQLFQEELAHGTESERERLDLYQQAEETYRHLRKVTENQGMFEDAGNFFVREMTMRRYQMPPYSFRRMVSKSVDVFCGYGERPMRVIIFSALAILFFALNYFLIGISDGGHPLRMNTELPLLTNLSNFMSCLYFSIVTFTTLGYGDLTPTGLARANAATEAFVGSFTLALFVVVFVKKMTR
ncbi:MAG: pentapeptide repeat-containing protein [Hahellaceae bacterium]|nr:pentapeptide repeat-containing protein [Hahellaceae bacterium]MCP5168239.1 pentapeptide repeat-containing protein [Hahellaceae bacterium]